MMVDSGAKLIGQHILKENNFETEIKKGNKKDRELVVSFKLNGKKYESKNKIAHVETENEGKENQFSLNFNGLFFNTQDWLEEINRLAPLWTAKR